MKGQNSPNFLGIKKNVVARKPIDSQIIQLETITQSLIPYHRSIAGVTFNLEIFAPQPKNRSRAPVVKLISAH